MIAGLVLAGGRSTRFGREKAVAELGARPLIAWVVEVLTAGCGCVAVNAPEGSQAAGFAREHSLTLVSDRPEAPDGPLAGIEAGLAWAREAGAALLATAPCDTPLLPHELVPRLAAALEPQHRAAVACVDEGLQPLCAVWRTSTLEHVAAATAGGRHPPIRALLADLGAVEVRFAEAGLFANVNTPGDQAAALARLGDVETATRS